MGAADIMKKKRTVYLIRVIRQAVNFPSINSNKEINANKRGRDKVYVNFG